MADSETTTAATAYHRVFDGITLTPQTDCEVMYLGGFGADWKRYHTEKALWDTGAMTTTITKEVADQLGITVEEWSNVGSVGGNVVAGKAMINLKLDDIVIPFLSVNVIDLTEREKEARKMSVPYNHPDVWIGMDVIAMGWLAIDSTLGKTILTFGVENETPSGKYDESDIFEYEGDKDPIPLKY